MSCVAKLYATLSLRVVMCSCLLNQKKKKKRRESDVNVLQIAFRFHVSSHTVVCFCFSCWHVNLLSAMWRIYQSPNWSSQWPYNGYIRHGWMTSCGRGRDSATPECFGRGSQGTIFVRSSKLSLFFPELCSFRWVFVSRAFVRFGTKLSSSGAFGFDDVLELFLKTTLRNRAFFANSDYDHEFFFEIFFHFS